ncbi:hypothetical protein OG21DRAFT_1242933 [Imleria badia]|nr:hypothetical protein OG21DRAFT_1242933 [Imleria badia]
MCRRAEYFGTRAVEYRRERHDLLSASFEPIARHRSSLSQTLSPIRSRVTNVYHRGDPLLVAFVFIVRLSMRREPREGNWRASGLGHSEVPGVSMLLARSLQHVPHPRCLGCFPTLAKPKPLSEGHKTVVQWIGPPHSVRTFQKPASLHPRALLSGPSTRNLTGLAMN